MKICESFSKQFYAYSDISNTMVIKGRCYWFDGPVVATASGFPVARVHKQTGIVVGLRGNSGNRFDRLSAIEKMDIGTLVNSLVNCGEVDRLPTPTEQNFTEWTFTKAVYSKD